MKYFIFLMIFFSFASSFTYGFEEYEVFKVYEEKKELENEIRLYRNIIFTLFQKRSKYQKRSALNCEHGNSLILQYLMAAPYLNLKSFSLQKYVKDKKIMMLLLKCRGNFVKYIDDLSVLDRGDFEVVLEKWSFEESVKGINSVSHNTLASYFIRAGINIDIDLAKRILSKDLLSSYQIFSLYPNQKKALIRLYQNSFSKLFAESKSVGWLDNFINHQRALIKKEGKILNFILDEFSTDERLLHKGFHALVERKILKEKDVIDFYDKKVSGCSRINYTNVRWVRLKKETFNRCIDQEITKLKNHIEKYKARAFVAGQDPIQRYMNTFLVHTDLFEDEEIFNKAINLHGPALLMMAREKKLTKKVKSYIEKHKGKLKKLTLKYHERFSKGSLDFLDCSYFVPSFLKEDKDVLVSAKRAFPPCVKSANSDLLAIDELLDVWITFKKRKFNVKNKGFVGVITDDYLKKYFPNSGTYYKRLRGVKVFSIFEEVDPLNLKRAGLLKKSLKYFEEGHLFLKKGYKDKKYFELKNTFKWRNQ